MLDGALELLGVVLTVEEGTTQAPFTFFAEGENGLAGADGPGQQRTAFARTWVGRAVFFLFSAVVEIPAVHGVLSGERDIAATARPETEEPREWR